MKILALEFSSPHRSVAVLDTDASKPRAAGSSRESQGRDTHAFAMIEKALDQAGVSRESIECLVIGLGPGSYTGIRVAISLAQGWQLARGIKLLGISSVECLAVQAQEQQLHGRVNIAIDAQRNEFYLASYNVTDALLDLAEPLRLISAEQVRELISKGVQVIGPDVSSSFPGARDFWPDARTLARLAAGRTNFIHGEQLEPIYLRPATFVKAPPPRILPP